LYWWLHSDTAYTFNGDAPIAGLTPNELDVLHLGKVVEAEQRRDAADGSDVGGRKRELKQKHRQARREQFDNLSYQ
jgi:hypothetical protein